MFHFPNNRDETRGRPFIALVALLWSHLAGASRKHDILHVLNVNKVVPERIKEFIDVIILSTQLFCHMTISLCGNSDIEDNGFSEGDRYERDTVKSCDNPCAAHETNGRIKVAQGETKG